MVVGFHGLGFTVFPATLSNFGVCHFLPLVSGFATSHTCQKFRVCDGRLVVGSGCVLLSVAQFKSTVCLSPHFFSFEVYVCVMFRVFHFLLVLGSGSDFFWKVSV